MNFHEERFPAKLSLGSIGGPERRTEIVTIASGFEERNSPWKHSRRRYDAGVAMRSLDDMQNVIAFFEARQGRLFGFRWKDWSDYKSAAPSNVITPTDQELGIGDGLRDIWQLCKTYRSGAHDYCREISKPVSGTVLLAVDDVEIFEGDDFNIDVNSGKIHFHNPPSEGALVTAGFEFDVPVRFDTDRLEMTVAGFQSGEVPNVPVVEVRV
ncbi:glycoside hydrolase family 24 [Amylibacter kogurei]|uniref:Glycoside hydrolase family 24 n=1 Tax=Paramylibacter kogurei TaxID=1889778 RepID=A0A2G5K757_9RHOB|nr:DUF2460 domain-containing protein [Amylibacter kogurei]PIB24959.1 glycoside hydrolase family 24 [Amylibacter kogurei]